MAKSVTYGELTPNSWSEGRKFYRQRNGIQTPWNDEITRGGANWLMFQLECEIHAYSWVVTICFINVQRQKEKWRYWRRLTE